MENSPDYPEVLLKMYSSTQDLTLRMMHLICLRSYIVQTMTSKRRAFKKTVSMTIEGFALIRKKLVDELNLSTGLPTRPLLDDLMGVICSIQFPTNSEELLWYLKTSLEDNNMGINQKVAAIKTCAKVFKELYSKSVTANFQHFESLVNHIFPSLVALWELTTGELESAIKEQNVGLVTLGRQIDKLFIYLLLLGGDNHDNTVVEQCVSKLIEKAEVVLTLLKQTETSPVAGNFELMENLSKNAVVLLYDFSRLVQKSPFSFSNLLTRVPNFAFEVLKMDWNNPNIRKSALLLILAFLKQFVYSVDPEWYKSSKLASRSKNGAKLQPHCRAKFFEFFNREEFIQEFVSILGLKLMGIDEDESDTEKNLDAEIESGEVQGMETTADELELPIRRIAVTAAEQLGLKCPATVLPLLLFLTDTIMTGSLKDAELKIKNNILQLVGLLPQIYDKLKRNDTPNIDQFLSWVSHQSIKYTFFSRRFAVLLRQWSHYLSPEVKMKHFPTLIDLLNNKDLITRYAALRTLCEFIEKDEKAEMNYQYIHNAIAPAIVQVCDCVSTPHLIWPLLRSLSTVMERIQSQEGSTFEPFKNIQGLNFQNLLSKDDPTVRQGMIDVFKTVIVSVPPGAPIFYVYETAANFLRMILPKVVGTDTTEISFWKFLIKEIPQNSPEQLLKQYAALLFEYQSKLNHFDDPSQICETLSLVDEYFILLRELPFRYINITKSH